MAEDIFDFMDAKSRQRENEKERKLDDLADKIAVAIKSIKFPEIEVKVAAPVIQAAAPVVQMVQNTASYHFTINRNSKGLIESIDAEVKG